MSEITSSLDRKPRLACEICADRVVAARGSESGDLVEVSSMRNLPSGSILPGLVNANIADRNAVVVAVKDVMAAVGGRGRDVIAVLPDGACRVVLLDFDALPEKKQDAEAVIRFRLKKSLPFDIDRARMSYDVQHSDGNISIVAAVALASVLDEYEEVLRDAGYTPGIVMPSTLAALGSVNTTRPTLVIKVDPDTMSFSILNNNELLLFRTLENPAGASVDGGHLAEDVHPSLVFFQDTYGLAVEQILIGGVQNVSELARALEQSTGVHVQELVSTSHLAFGASGSTPRAILGGVTGALIS